MDDSRRTIAAIIAIVFIAIALILHPVLVITVLLLLVVGASIVLALICWMLGLPVAREGEHDGR